MALYDDVRALLPTGGRGVVRRPGITTLAVEGPDAVDFLQRLCSQDVQGLAVGAAAPASFLSAKGRLVTTAWIGRLRADALVVAVAAEHAPGLAELLDRYHFTERLEIRSGADVAVAVIGTDAPAALGETPGRCVERAGGILVTGGRHGFSFAWWAGPETGAGEVAGALPELDPELAEAVRIAAGEPRVGVDTDERTLALEAGLDDHVSTTKGCYTGQEIVARIHTYGHVNRRLVPLRLATAEPPAPGTAIVARGDGDPVGRVTSAVAPPGARFCVALGYLPERLLADPPELALGDATGPAVQVERFGPA